MVRVDFERGWVSGPGVTNRLEGGSPPQRLEVLGEVVGRDEGQDVGCEALQVASWKTFTVASLIVRFIRSA